MFWDNHGPNDGFFESLDALLEWHEDEAEDDINPLPNYVFTCREIPFRGLDASDLIECCTEDSFDGAYEQVDGHAELQAACAAFNAANAHLVTYEPDWKKAVAVPREDP